MSEGAEASRGQGPCPRSWSRVRQSLVLDSMVRTRVQDSFLSTTGAVEHRKDRACLLNWVPGDSFLTVPAMESAGLSPPSCRGPESSCMHLGRGLVAKMGGPLEWKGPEQSPRHQCPAIALLVLWILFPPSSIQPPALGSAAEGSAPPIAELTLPRPGRMWET